MTENKKVLNAILNMTKAFENKDIKTVMNSYEDKAAVLFEPDTPTNEAAVIQQMFEGSFAANPQFTYSGHQVYVSGDIALHISPWKMAAKTPDGQKIEQSGLSVAVLRKQDTGEWKIVIDNPHGQMLLGAQ